MSYAGRSTALDARILEAIDGWRRGRAFGEAEFEALALELLAYQLEFNRAYARYCASLGVSLASMPQSWRAIPAVPAAAFKEATLTTFDPANAALAFETSGTTTGLGGRHYMDTRALYDAALLAGFDAFVLADGARLRYFNFVPNPADRPQSSLGYMMQQVSLQRGDGDTGWYVRGDDLFVDAFLRDARSAIDEGVPVCIATTAFALVHVLEELERRGAALALPAGSRIMETGGFKGRARVVERPELYLRAAARLGIPQHAILAEYGMTELTSQYYDAVAPGAPVRAGVRRKRCGPWLRTRVVGPDGYDLPDGTVGALVHVDLANRGSCVAIATEDLGALFDGDLVLVGREAGAALRGCSLDAETLQAR